MIERIDHANLVVGDLPAMIGFYRDVLGLQLTRQATISGAWIGAVTGLPAVEADVAFLQPPSGPAIELIRYRTPAGQRPDGQGVANNQGLRHLAFRVADIDRLVAKMEAAGVRFVARFSRFRPPRSITPTCGNASSIAAIPKAICWNCVPIPSPSLLTGWRG